MFKKDIRPIVGKQPTYVGSITEQKSEKYYGQLL